MSSVCIKLIKFLYLTSGLTLTASFLNLLLACVVAVAKDSPVLAKHKVSLERYAIVSMYVTIPSTFAFLVSGNFLHVVKQEQREREYSASLLASHSQESWDCRRRQALKAGLIAEQCCTCIYFAGFDTPIRCTVNPAGNPNDCRDGISTPQTGKPEAK